MTSLFSQQIAAMEMQVKLAQIEKDRNERLEKFQQDVHKRVQRIRREKLNEEINKSIEKVIYVLKVVPFIRKQYLK